MASIKIEETLCKGCGLCVSVCPQKILEISKTIINKSGYNVVVNINPDKCIGCAACAIMCPDCVIEVDR